MTEVFVDSHFQQSAYQEETDYAMEQRYDLAAQIMAVIGLLCPDKKFEELHKPNFMRRNSFLKPRHVI